MSERLTVCHFEWSWSPRNSRRDGMFREVRVKVKIFQNSIWDFQAIGKLSPQNCRNEQEILEKCTFIFCAKP